MKNGESSLVVTDHSFDSQRTNRIPPHQYIETKPWELTIPLQCCATTVDINIGDINYKPVVMRTLLRGVTEHGTHGSNKYGDERDEECSGNVSKYKTRLG